MESQQWWSEGIWNETKILCEEVQPHKIYRAFWEHQLYPLDSYSSILLCNLAIILTVTITTWFFLKPLRMPFTSQMIVSFYISLEL